MARSNRISRIFVVLVTSYAAYRLYTREPAAPILSPAQQAVKDALKHELVVFSKSHCPYSLRAKSILSKYVPNYHVVELDINPNGQEIQDIMMEMTGARTVPRVFVNGAFIGGADDLGQLDDGGELLPLLQKKGIAVARA